jgi:WD repeat-containing protein 59
MPATMDQMRKKAKIIRTADESETFEANVTIHVDGFVGSATISPSGRDVALAS